MDVFNFAQAYIAMAFGAASTWVMNVLDAIGATGFVARMFFIGVTVSVLILPLRGAAISQASSDYVNERKFRKEKARKEKVSGRIGFGRD